MPSRVERVLPGLLVAVACIASLLNFHEQWSVHAPPINDHLLHLTLVAGAEQALEAGQDPRDFWLPYWGQGFPMARYYQHLPHLLVVAVHKLAFARIPLQTVYDACVLLGLALLPLAVFVGGRALGMARHTAALFALIFPLLAADRQQTHFLGLQSEKFVSLHGGMFAQLGGAVFFALAVGLSHRAVLSGKRYAPALLALSCTWLSHLLLGYSACLFAALAALRPEARKQRARVILRLVGLYAATFAVASYLLVPSLFESRLLSKTLWEPSVYWDGFGAAMILPAYARGALLDGGRLPVLTLLSAIGAVCVVFQLRQRDREDAGAGLAALCIAGLSLLFLCGRETFGSAFAFLPFASMLPIHRFICGFQYGAVALAAIALGRGFRFLGFDASVPRALAALGLTMAALWPAVQSTFEVGRENAKVRRDIAHDLAIDGALVTAQMDRFSTILRYRPGRCYAGTTWDWGTGFRLAHVPVFLYFPLHGIPALSYMAHTMSLNSDLEPLFDPTRRDHYDLFNVRCLLVPNAEALPAFATGIGGAANFLSATVDARGYFDLVAVDHVFDATGRPPDELRVLSTQFVLSTWHSRQQFVRVRWTAEEKTTGLAAVAATEAFASPPVGRAPRGLVLSEWAHAGTYCANVRSDEATTLLFRMTYHPNWRARVDGRDVTPVMLLPSYVGIPIERGRHLVELAYEPDSQTAWLTLLGIAALLLAALFDLRRQQAERGAH